MFERFREDRSGATSIEYALVASLASIAIVVAVQATGANLNTKFFGLIIAGLQ